MLPTNSKDENAPARSKRGFAAMDPKNQRAISAAGGKASGESRRKNSIKNSNNQNNQGNQRNSSDAAGQ